MLHTKSMRITKLVLWVQENKLSEKFYKKLGFSVAQSDDDHSLMLLNSFGIDLVSMRDEKPFTPDSMSGDKGRGMYIYIQVDNVDLACEGLLAKGIRPYTKPKDWPWGNREFITKDPDGYKLCFYQSLTE
jgi:uncharacterized glyoxalase superfamily protein PhnB